MKQTKENPQQPVSYQLRRGLQMRMFGLDFGIYDHESKQIYMLNPTAGLIFNYLSTGKPYDEIIQNIVIAFGKSSAGRTANMKRDLEKMVNEFIKLKLVEPAQNTGYELAEPLAISENEMTSLPMAYLPPQLKAYSVEELVKKYRDRKITSDFSDTWNPTKNGVSFLDVYSPVNPSAKFLDTWKPNGISTKFLDTWTPENGRVWFLDTWRPDQKTIENLKNNPENKG